MRILLINHYAGSRVHGMEYRPFYLARSWRAAGCETSVVAASFSHLRTTSPKVEWGLSEEIVEEIPYFWLRTPHYEGNGLRRALNMFAFSGQLLRYGSFLAERSKADLVITASTYPLANIPAYYIAKKLGAKLVYEVRDLWPLTLTELAGMPAWHPFILLMQWAENFSYRKSDLVACSLPNAAGHMVQHGMDAKKFAYLPNGVAAAEWQEQLADLPEPHAKTLRDLKAQGRFLLGYCGSHGVSNGLGFFLDAAGLVRQDTVTFVFVGQGPGKEFLERNACCRKLGNVVFLPAVRKACMPALSALLDGFFLGWQKKPIYQFGISPNKLLDYMMAGKPIIHAAEAANDLVAESRCGFTVPPEDPQAIADAVLKLVSLAPPERQAMGQQGRRYVLEHHDYNVIARRYLELFHSALFPIKPPHPLSHLSDRHACEPVSSSGWSAGG